MQTQVIRANSKHNIKLAAEIIRKGGLVAFPTETVYGLGADATNKTAVTEIFKTKERPFFDPLIVHVADNVMFSTLVGEITEMARQLTEAFWPGPLTIVVYKTTRIPDVVTAGLPTLAVRMPLNDVALKLIKEAGVPIAAPSANRFGRPSPTRADHVLDDLEGRIPLILDGGQTQIGIESTVIDLTCSPPIILRPGGVSQEGIEAILGKVKVASGNEKKTLTSPGSMVRHYSPRAKLMLFEGEHREATLIRMYYTAIELKRYGNVGVLVPHEDLSYFDDDEIMMASFGSFTNMEEVALNLFASLRALDKKGVSHILVLAPPKQGIGLAVFDRLYKAAGSHLITVP